MELGFIKNEELLLREVNFYENVFWYAESHELTHRPVIGIQIDQSSVNPHLPLVPSLRSLAVGRFHRRNLQFLGRKRLRTLDLHACLFSDVLYFLANIFQTPEVCDW